MSRAKLTDLGHVWIDCPGCRYPHVADKRWAFNGSLESPTLSPSLLVTTPGVDDGEWKIEATRCHSFVTDGRIQFLSDCTHELAGQTIDLPEVTS